MTPNRELIELFCQMKEGWIPDVGTVYTVTLDHGQRTALMGILQSAPVPEGVAQDAARYQWLRVNSTKPVEPWSTHTPESFDKMVDEEIKHRSPPQQEPRK